MCMVRAAVGHARDAILQRQPRGEDGAADANGGALHELGGPGEAYGAHVLAWESAGAKGVDIGRVVDQCEVLSGWVGWLETALHAGVAQCEVEERVFWHWEAVPVWYWVDGKVRVVDDWVHKRVGC